MTGVLPIRTALWRQTVAYAVAYLPTYLLPHEVTSYLQLQGLNEGDAGLLAMIENGALAVANLSVAALSARQRHRLLILASLVAIGANALSAFRLPMRVLALLRAANGAAFGVGGFVAAQSIARGVAPARAFGIANGMLAVLAGVFLWLVPALPGTPGTQVFFCLTGIALLLALTVRSPPRESVQERAELENVSLGVLLGRPAVLGMLISTGLLFSSLGGLYDFAVYQGVHIGMSDSAVGAALGWTTVTGLLGGSAAGTLCARHGLSLPMWLSVLLASGTCIAVGLVATPLEFVIAFTVFSATYMFAMTTLATTGAVIDPSGRVAATLVGAQILAVAAGALCVGLLLERKAAWLSWSLGATLCACAMVPAMFSARRADAFEKHVNRTTVHHVIR